MVQVHSQEIQVSTSSFTVNIAKNKKNPLNQTKRKDKLLPEEFNEKASRKLTSQANS